ncbi:hypothetical protein M3Y97_00000600 [Aphelenchoides bicaudatus]|nr:hypothetical protein M3Y97_00000600 [Aphelenchoides bicaudatus]
MGLPIPILQYMFTLLIAIPSVCSLVFLLVQFSKSCVRASTQLSVHCWAWILYFASGFIHAAYVLIRWKGADHVYSEPIYQVTIVFHLSLAFLLPLAVLVATVDRCISLRWPTYYALFNGDTMRVCTVVFSISLIFVTWVWIFQIVNQINSSYSGSYYLADCPEINEFIHKFILYKAVFGFLNIIVSSIFIYLFMNYQKRGRGLDKIKNNLIFIVLVAELLFNVFPPLIYWILSMSPQFEMIGFAPLVFACINLDGICTVVVYIATYKRKQKQFHQCKPRQPFSAHTNPFKSNRPVSTSSISHTGNFRIKEQQAPPSLTRAMTR